MRVATGMLSVLALWSGLAMAQSAALTLPREDGSSIHYYLDAAVPGQSSAALLVILQGSDCNSVRHIRLVTPMRQVLPAADLLTVEKYGIDDTLPYREEVPRQDCPDAFVQHDTPQRRVSDVTQVLQAVSARNGYQKVAVLGGSEGAVIANLVTASSGLVDATLAFSGGGRWFIDDVRHSVADAPNDALEQTVAASAQQVSGTLRVNAPLSFGLTVLSPLLPPFMQRYPQLQVELTLDDRVLDVVAAGFDISLRIRRRLPDSSLSARALGDVHQRICAAPGYLAQHGVPQTPNELPRHSCLAYSLAEKPGQWQFTAGEESLSVTFTPRLIANNSLMLRDMLVAGLGIGSLPSFVADPEIAAGRLVQLFPEQIADVHQVFAVYPTRRHVQQKVSLFTELVREQGLMTAN